MWHTLGAYQESLSRSLYPSRITVGQSHLPFRARSDIRAFGRLSVLKAYANVPFVLEPLSHWTAREDSYVLHLQLAGDTAYAHCRGEVTCTTNSLLLTNSKNVIAAEQRSEADAIVVKIPGAMLRQQVNDAERYCWVATHADTGAASLLRSYLLDLWNCHVHLDERARELLSLSLLYQIEAVFGPDSANAIRASVSRQGGTQGLYERLSHEIGIRVGDTELKGEDLAAALGMSRSKLYRLTREAGTTVEKLVIDTRLGHVARRIETLREGEATLTAIAFECGFNDMSHFSRCFKRKFGISPSAFRKLGRRAN